MKPSREKTVDEMSDEEVLQKTGHGRYGAALVGQQLADRAKTIMRGTAGGRFGPALIDSDFSKRTPPSDETSEVNVVDDDPWAAVTLSGAKILARDNGVSYSPKVKRAELIDALKAKGVTPPEPVDVTVDEDDDA